MKQEPGQSSCSRRSYSRGTVQTSDSVTFSKTVILASLWGSPHQVTFSCAESPSGSPPTMLPPSLLPTLSLFLSSVHGKCFPGLCSEPLSLAYARLSQGSSLGSWDGAECCHQLMSRTRMRLALKMRRLWDLDPRIPLCTPFGRVLPCCCICLCLGCDLNPMAHHKV